MISSDDSSQKRASMIQEMHFRNLSQKVSEKVKEKMHERCQYNEYFSHGLQVLLVKRTEEAARQLESTKLHTTSGR